MDRACHIAADPVLPSQEEDAMAHGPTYDERHEDLAPDDAPRPAPRGAPGRVPVTARLAPATTQYIFRVADPATAEALGRAFAPRDDNHVAADADGAVARAAGSTGQPLPDGVRERFESSLGVDLSPVRVHTGAASAEAAHAVGARAYTEGQDIHFAANQYAHEDPFGMHLLAHEVAHTVQQRGGTPHRQHKLEVSTPGDASELEADRAADAMVAGAPATVSAGDGIVARQEDPFLDTEEEVGPPLPNHVEQTDEEKRELEEQSRNQVEQSDEEKKALEDETAAKRAATSWVNVGSGPADPQPESPVAVPPPLMTQVETPQAKAMVAGYGAFGAALGQQVGAWNAAVPSLRAYYVPSDSERATLRDTEGFAVPDAPGSVSDWGGKQLPAADNDNRTSTDAAFGGKGKSGIHLDDKDKAGLHKAGDNAEVKGLLEKRAAADSLVRGETALVKSASAGCGEAQSELLAASAEVAASDEVKKQTKAQSEIDEINAACAALKSSASKVISVVKNLATIGVDVMTGQDPSGSIIDAGASLLEQVAEDAADAKFEIQLTNATNALARAVSNINSLKSAAAREKLAAKGQAAERTAQALNGQVAKLTSVRITRRETYRALAKAVRKHSGLDPKRAKLLEAALASMPVIDSVVTRGTGCLAALTPVEPNESALLGYSALHASGAGAQMRRLYGQMAGYRIAIPGELINWALRLASVQKLIDELRAGNSAVEQP
jgi:hypothetical protein